MARLNDEQDNIRVTLGWADKTDVEAGLYLSARLYRFWESFDIREGVHWLAELIENPDSKAYSHASAKALFAQGRLLGWLQQFPQARFAALASLDLFRACGDRQGEIDSLLQVGFLSDATQKIDCIKQALALAQSLGDIWRQALALFQTESYDDPFERWEQAIVLFRQSGDLYMLANALSMSGYFVMLEGDLVLAQRKLEEAVRLNNQLNDKDAKCTLLYSLGQMAIIQRDYDKAHIYLQEAQDTWEELGARMNVLWCHTHLGYLALHRGNINEAQKIFNETAREFFNDKSEAGVGFVLEGIAGLSVIVGKFDIASKLVGWADATRKKMNDRRPRLEQVDVDKIIAACLAKMGETVFADAYEDGQKMTLDEAIEYALRES
jgi:tetratricopeptide (TPR) repeat protein